MKERGEGINREGRGVQKQEEHEYGGGDFHRANIHIYDYDL